MNLSIEQGGKEVSVNMVPSVDADKFFFVFVLNRLLIVLVRTIRVLYVSDRTFFCTAELKKGFWRRGFCHRVKFRTLKGFCQFFYRFFETLDAFGSFHFSTEPFWRVLDFSFFFSEQAYLHLS